MDRTLVRLSDAELSTQRREMTTMKMKMMSVFWLTTALMASSVNSERVDKRNNSLTSIPADYPTNLTELILSHNSIAMDSSDIRTLQKYPGITLLDLSYNRIQTLPSGAFDSLTNLQTLKLRGNGLQTLDKDIFKGLSKLKSLDLEENPLNCSCSLSSLIKQLNDSGVSVGKDMTCYAPQKTAVFEGNASCLVKALLENPTAPSTALPHSELSSSSHVNSSSKEFIGSGDGTLAGSSSWKFLLGVVVLTLSTSMLIVCAVKSPSWYKLLFNYRHQRLREDVEHNTFNTGRISNFSLDTEQTETSTQELDDGLEAGLSLQTFEDDDGFIEDGYIEPGNYSESADANES